MSTRNHGATPMYNTPIYELAPSPPPPNDYHYDRIPPYNDPYVRPSPYPAQRPPSPGLFPPQTLPTITPVSMATNQLTSAERRAVYTYSKTDSLPGIWPLSETRFQNHIAHSSLRGELKGYQLDYDCNHHVDQIVMIALTLSRSFDARGVRQYKFLPASFMTRPAFLQHLEQVKAAKIPSAVLYFSSDWDERIVFVNHCRQLLAICKAPPAMAITWNSAYTGGFGCYKDKDAEGKITAIHTWVQYRVPSPKVLEPVYYAGNKLVQWLTTKGVVLENTGMYTRWEAATKTYTVLIVGRSTLYTRLCTLIEGDAGQPVRDNPYALITLALMDIIENVGEVLHIYHEEVEKLKGLYPYMALERCQLIFRDCASGKNLLKCAQDDINKLNKLFRSTMSDQYVNRDSSTSFALPSPEWWNELVDDCLDKGRRIELALEVLVDVTQKTIDVILGTATLQNAEQSKASTLESKKDTAVMRTIAIVTAAFLPPTALATVLGMSWRPENSFWSESRIFSIAVGPLTIITLLLTFYWIRRMEKMTS